MEYVVVYCVALARLFGVGEYVALPSVAPMVVAVSHLLHGVGVYLYSVDRVTAKVDD